jgi:hypothetical protein
MAPSQSGAWKFESQTTEQLGKIILPFLGIKSFSNDRRYCASSYKKYSA